MSVISAFTSLFHGAASETLSHKIEGNKEGRKEGENKPASGPVSRLRCSGQLLPLTA